VTLEITPEPAPEERAAIAAALELLLAEREEDSPAPWWLAGVRESVEEPEQGPFHSTEEA